MDRKLAPKIVELCSLAINQIYKKEIESGCVKVFTGMEVAGGMLVAQMVSDQR